MNNPYANKDGTVGAYADTYAENELVPKPLQGFLYNDPNVTPEDLAYYLQLSTQPIGAGDIEMPLR